MDIRPVSLRRPAYPLLTALTAAAVIAACNDKPQQSAGGNTAPDIAPAAETEEEQLTSGFIVPARLWNPPAVSPDADTIPTPETPEMPAGDTPAEVEALPAAEAPLSEP